MFSSTADDEYELFPPLLSEIKEGQWLGVTVSTQKPSGVVSYLYPKKYFNQKINIKLLLSIVDSN